MDFPERRTQLFKSRRLLAFAGLLLGWGLFIAPAGAQQYTSLEIDESAKNLKYKAQQFAKSGAGAEADFKAYINTYAIPKLTDSRPQGLAELGKLRYEVFRDFVLAADSTRQAELTKSLQDSMQKVVLNNGGPFHPAVRYNAIIVIGLLDSTYSDGRERAAVPLPAANEFLTNVVKQGVADGKAPAFLVVGALVGLERHASVVASLPAANQKATLDALISVIEAKELPLEVSSSVEQWMRLIAARGIAATKSLGEGNRYHQALFSLINNEQAKLNIRCQAAELLAGLSTAYQSANGIDERQLAQSLLQLASDVAADERQKALDYEKKTIRGGLNTYETSEVKLPDPYQVRRTVLRLRGTLAALKAARPAVKNAEMQTTLGDVEKELATVLAIAEDKDVIAINLARDVKKMANRVETIAGQAGIEAVEPVEEEDEEEEVAGAPTIQAEGAVTPP